MSKQAIVVKLQQAQAIPLDVELTAKQGEILAILGPSGSGKTTVLRSIAGLYQPRSGRITCDNHHWFDSEQGLNLPTRQRPVGFMFQDYALFPHLNIQQNIVTALGHMKKDRRKGRVIELLQMVNMAGLGPRYPHQLSGGQRQRIALARALAREPKVLLLDEPFSSVDHQTRRKLVRELVQLRAQLNMPIIHVTHDLREARRIADRISIIHHGKTLQTDTPANIMSKPDNAEVAHLTGHYNIFTGEVRKHDTDSRKTYLQWCGYQLETPYRPTLEIGKKTDWLIPSENIILHRRDRPSKGERENPISGTVEEFIPLGESSAITMKVQAAGQYLSLSIPTHVARRNHIEKDSAITVSLLCEGIHLMARRQEQKPARHT